MPSFFVKGLMATLLAGSAAAHMQMDFPAPFRSKANPFTTNVDYSMQAPLSPDGSNYPCKGYHSDLGTDAGRPTANFAQGQTYNISIVGGAPHGGGSCQISLSYDKGKTFTVIESIIGGCPLKQHYDFTVPADAQAGEALLSWSWHNQIGNREMYQNCAAVTIGGGGAKRAIKERAAAFQSRPQIFVANVGNGCSVGEGAPVQYPNPGPDVEGTLSGAVPPEGNCGSSSGGGGGGGNGGGAPAPTSNPVAPPNPDPSPAPPTTTAAPAEPTVTLPGGVFITISSEDGAPAPTDVAGPAPVAPTSEKPAAPAPTTEAPVAPAPTTLQTTTKASTAAPPAGTGGAGSGSGSGSHAVGATCSTEGAWNCINGTSFQRCASGSWSAIISMAAGTQCTPGESETFAMKAVTGRRTIRARKW